MKFVDKFLLRFLILLTPTQLALHFWPKWAFVYGLRIDLVAPAIYLTDILALFFIVVCFCKFWPRFKEFFKKNKWYIVFMLLFAGLNVFFSISIWETVYKWIKVVELVLLIFCFRENPYFEHKIVYKSLLVSALVVSVLGICQFISNKSIGGFMYLFGERSFTGQTPGIALVNINGALNLRAYSFFSHPNSLAGYLGLIIIISLFNKVFANEIFQKLNTGLVIICFILTFSLSGYLGLFTVLLLYLFRKVRFNKIFSSILFLNISVFVSLVIPLISDFLLTKLRFAQEEIIQRLQLSLLAGKIISEHVIFGTGLGTFIANVPKYQNLNFHPWLLQPVHNIFLLLFVETGVVGLIIFIYAIRKLFMLASINKTSCTSYLLVFIVFTGLFDHYSLSLQQNILLFGLVAGLVLKYENAN